MEFCINSKKSFFYIGYTFNHVNESVVGQFFKLFS